MISLIRYNTISSLPGKMKLIDVVLPTAEQSGKYCVDTSHFVPRAESVVSLKAGDQPTERMYDFPDGKAGNVAVPRSRSHSYTGDIAEASVNAKASKSDYDKSLASAREEFERQQAMDSLKAAYGDSGSSGATQ